LRHRSIKLVRNNLKATRNNDPANVRFWPILLHKSVAEFFGQ
jgi:hypothetical protein